MTVFMVSWRSADESMAEVTWDDYVRAQIEAIDSIRERLERARGAHDRLLRRRHHARRDAGDPRPARRGRQGRQRDLPHRASRFRARRRPQGVHRRRPARAGPPGEQGRLPRRPLHGRDLQPAARHRPDLEHGDQPLPARRGLPGVRPAALERRRHQPAGQVARGLLARLLPRQQAGRARRAERRRHPDRPAAGRDPGLRPGRPRGPHRPARERPPHARACSPARCASCSPAAATSPAWSTRRRRTSTATGPATIRARSLEAFLRGAEEHPGQLVDRLAGVARRRSTRRKSPRKASARPAAAATR